MPDGSVVAESAVPSLTPSWIHIDATLVPYSDYAFAGFVKVIAADPRSADVVYSGSNQYGGLWKTTDFTSGAPHWTPILDGSIGGLDLDPRAPDTLYAGISYWVGNDGQVVKSTDGGATWSAPVGVTGQVEAIRVDPTLSSIVIVGTQAGIFRSTDGGATYKQQTTPPNNGVTTLAFVGAANGESVWVATAGGDVWRSVDSGATWISVAGGAPFVADKPANMSVAAAATTGPDTTPVFILASTDNGTSLYRSLDGGKTFAPVSGPLSNAGDNCATTADILGGQGWYDQAIAVDPTDGNHVLFAGENCSVRSLDALAPKPAFSRTSTWVSSNDKAKYVGSDWHGALITSVGGVVRTFSGNDMGLHHSTNLWTTPVGMEGTIDWHGDNFGMDSLLFEQFATGDPALGNDDVLVGSMQDNGTVLGIRQGAGAGAGGTWNGVAGGDSNPIAVNKGTAGQFFLYYGVPSWFCAGDALECQTGSKEPSLPVAVPAGDTPDNTDICAVQTDPTGAAFLGATKFNVWVSRAGQDDAGAATLEWGSISGTQCDSTGQCSTGSFRLALGRVFASQKVPGLYGVVLNDGSVAVTGDGNSAGPHWTRSLPLPAGGTKDVALPGAVASGATAGDMYVVVDGSNSVPPPPQGHIFLTNDRGKSWQSIQGRGAGSDLPNVPLSTVRFDPSDATNKTIYVGTMIGVYRTTDGGATWVRFGTGFPTSYVTRVYVSLDGSMVRASTRGRGIWEIHPK